MCLKFSILVYNIEIGSACLMISLPGSKIFIWFRNICNKTMAEVGVYRMAYHKQFFDICSLIKVSALGRMFRIFSPARLVTVKLIPCAQFLLNLYPVHSSC